MISGYSKRWIIVGLIWAGAVVLTLWNVVQIEELRLAEKKREILRMDEQFWKYNLKNISIILEKSGSYYQPVAAANIGFLSVKNHLETLAAGYYLSDIRIGGHPDQSRDGLMPADISFKGRFLKAVLWLDALRKIPYIQVRTVKITLAKQISRQIDRRAPQYAEFNISFYYRYKTASMKSAG